jgi:heme/copper-type cytochrome/quinol oxidase subunit 3
MKPTGMTMTAGIFGACFFLLICTHGLHAAAAALISVYVYMRLTQHRLEPGRLWAVHVFRYFVVGIRRVLYGLVYF